jgi:receptor family ligand binding protein
MFSLRISQTGMSFVVTATLFLFGFVPGRADDLAIGLLVPAGQDLASLRGHIQAGVELAVDDVTKSRLLHDKPKIVVRTYSSPAEALARLMDIVEREKVNVVIGPATTSAATALQTKLGEYRVPSFLIASRIPAARSAAGTFQFTFDQATESAFSKSLREELSSKGIAGNSAEVMAAHQTFAITQMVAQIWKDGSGDQASKFVDAFQKKGSFDTVLGKISVKSGLMYCPNCTGVNCTYPKVICANNSRQCCDP